MQQLTHKHCVIEVFGGKLAELSAKGQGGCHAATAGGPCFALFDQHVSGFWFLQGRPKTHSDRADVIMRSRLALKESIQQMLSLSKFRDMEKCSL